MSNPSAVPGLPLFYSSPIPLELARHAEWRLLLGDLGFAAAATSSPVTASEFLAASRCFPVVFAAQDLSPMAVLGLEADNLFIEGGVWAEGAYMPAYVRRYPFVLIAAPDGKSFALGIDAASDRVAQKGEDGVALFEDGQPSVLTKQALDFCGAFNADHQRTAAFTKALNEAGVLVERRADIALPDGRKFGLTGFKVIDPDALMALPDDTVAAWHRAGWLALAYAHLASLDLFQVLLQRQSRRATQLSSKSDIEPAEPASVLQ